MYTDVDGLGITQHTDALGVYQIHTLLTLEPVYIWHIAVEYSVGIYIDKANHAI